MDWRAMMNSITGWLLTSGLKVLLILIVMFAALRIVRLIAHRLFGRLSNEKDPEFKKRVNTLGDITNYGLSIIIVLIAAMMIIGEFGVKIGPLLAAAGVLGLAVSFGAQHLVQDLISGFFILVEDKIRVGDVVQIGEYGGLVEKVGLRTTVLRDLAGNVHYIRNGHIEVVTNMTKEYSRYVFDIGVAYREDVDEVIEVIKQVDEEMRSDPEFKDDILEPIEILGLDRFADSAIVIKARTKTRPIRQWAVGRAFNRLLKKRFDERGIEIPFPHLTVYPGQDKRGRAPALNLNVRKSGEGSSRDTE